MPCTPLHPRHPAILPQRSAGRLASQLPPHKNQGRMAPPQRRLLSRTSRRGTHCSRRRSSSRCSAAPAWRSGAGPRGTAAPPTRPPCSTRLRGRRRTARCCPSRQRWSACPASTGAPPTHPRDRKIRPGTQHKLSARSTITRLAAARPTFFPDPPAFRRLFSRCRQAW